MDILGTQSDASVVERLLGRIAELETALQQRDGLLREQSEVLRLYAKQIEDLKQQIADLKGGGPPPKQPIPLPDWVKPNTHPTVKERSGEAAAKKRKRRQHNFTWRRREPTRTVEHACEHCPDCGRGLCGGWEHSRRQIVEIPAIQLDVVDHVVIARHCGVCGKDCVPKVDLTHEVLGHSHFGHRLVSLLAYLRTVCRLPKQAIQELLKALTGLDLSRGAISEVLHRVAKQGQERYAELAEELQNSSYVHADETGWRENGQNGYVWSFSTLRVRYFVHDKSRGQQVPQAVLGDRFRGVLVSDFYCAYHYYLGLHQRCWVHLLRDVRELKEKYPTDGVLAWAKNLRDLYDRAKAFSSECAKARQAARLGFQADLLELAVPYVGLCLPQSVLAKRLVQFEAELFTFVEHPQVPSENNAAERSVRPRVIARKISGGTRSPKGSKTMSVLASLFETWRSRAMNGLETCRIMLIASQQPKAATTN